ncbi:MAG: ribonuclease Z [Clostridia bacterium]|nr:ribonuclease Z [Clostridia bacterium]
MRIVFLGTSHGAPEVGRKCSCIMVETGKNRYLIDIGIDPIPDLKNRNIPVESVKKVFVTHMHGDHISGILPYIGGCSCWWFRFSNPEFYLPMDIEKFKIGMNAWFDMLGSKIKDFAFHRVNDGVICDDGTIKLTAYRTKHCEESYAYLLEAEGKRVFFSGDLCPDGPDKDFPTEVLNAPLDLAVCESAHFDATEYIPLFENKKDNIKQLVITHYTEQRVPFIHEMAATLKGVPVAIARDGMEFYI